MFPSPLYLVITLNKGHNTVLEALCTKFFINVGKIIGAEPIKLEISPTKSLSKFSQYLLKPEAKENLKPVFKSLISKDFVIISTSPC